MDNHLAQIETLFKQSDPKEQSGIKDRLRDLLDTLATPQEALLTRYNTACNPFCQTERSIADNR
jgi:hypothetical protein